MQKHKQIMMTRLPKHKKQARHTRDVSINYNKETGSKMKTRNLHHYLLIVLTFVFLCNCGERNGGSNATIEIAVTDLMVNNMTLVAIYADKPTQLTEVFRAIARDWVSAEMSPDRNHGGTDAYHLKRINLTKKKIVECIGDDGYAQYVRSRRLHKYLGDKIESKFGTNVVDRTKLDQALFESVSIAKKKARRLMPVDQEWLASAKLIKSFLETLDVDLAQSPIIGGIQGARDLVHELLAEQIAAVTSNGELVNSLMDEMRLIYREGERGQAATP